jgi:hypothetical protein
MMAENTKKLSIRSTKQEMLDAYNELAKSLEEKRDVELKPEQKSAEKETTLVMEKSNKLSLDGVSLGISQLKTEVNKTFSQVQESLENELLKYHELCQAVEAKEKELADIYEIRKSASSLMALIEAQNQRRNEFEIEMEKKKQTLADEIDGERKQWLVEQEQYKNQIKEQKGAEEKQRKREKDEYEYSFTREQLVAREKFDYEKEKTEKALSDKKEQLEKELSEREGIVAEREQAVKSLEDRILELEKTREEDREQAVTTTGEQLEAEFESKQVLLKKEFEGERNVLTTRIKSLEDTAKKQAEQILVFTQQLEHAADKVQDIAVKAIEGSSHSKMFDKLRNIVEERKKSESESKTKSE